MYTSIAFCFTSKTVKCMYLCMYVCGTVVKYSAYEVQHPFTSLRALIIEMLVLLIESDESVASMLSVSNNKIMLYVMQCSS